MTPSNPVTGSNTVVTKRYLIYFWFKWLKFGVRWPINWWPK